MHSAARLSVAVCPHCEDTEKEADQGSLVFEPFSKPKWKLSCSRCNVIMSVCDDAVKVSVSEQECECGSALLEVEFQKSKTPAGVENNRHTGCPFCDPILKPL